MGSGLSFAVLAAIGLLPALHAQEKVPTVKFRAVLHDPGQPTPDLFYTDGAGAIVQLNFRPRDLTLPLSTLPVKGSLVLYDKAAIDPGNPTASMAASVSLPPNIKEAIVVVLPAPVGQTPPYRMLVIDDSEKAFSKGESRVISLIGLELVIQAGEHKVPVHPGDITRVPPVRQVNEYKMAQTDFSYQKDDSWITFNERQLQYIDACRRIFIVHARQGAIAPTVTTIVDTSPARGQP
jgi:hypothetical protein